MIHYADIYFSRQTAFKSGLSRTLKHIKFLDIQNVRRIFISENKRFDVF
jgi:hypothetical protein